mmetsp:Transcript_13048/g.31758  ORF Transcript_13048/g.31758 Transcript_13048/m.31758 type:complete len:142 (-) Transcript_13048:550-975(-)
MPLWMTGGLGLIFRRVWRRFGIDIIKSIGWEIAVELTGDLLMLVEVAEEGQDEGWGQGVEIVETILQAVDHRIIGATAPRGDNRTKPFPGMIGKKMRFLNLTVLAAWRGLEARMKLNTIDILCISSGVGEEVEAAAQVEMS